MVSGQTWLWADDEDAVAAAGPYPPRYVGVFVGCVCV